MFCTTCGQQLQDTARYCSQCGRSTGPTVPPKRLYRVLSQRKIAGVCAGVARYLDADVTLVRVLWVLITLLTGVTLIAYIIAWIVLPTETDLAIERQFA
jgi:phage shock protein C